MLRATLWAWLPIVLLAGAVLATGGSLVPRHPAAHELPWSADPERIDLRGVPANHGLHDTLWLIHSDTRLLRDALHDGRLPAWNPWILGGVSQAANPMAGVHYPPNWLTALVPLPHARLLLGTLHLALLALGTVGLLRSLGLGVAACTFGALTLSFGGWITAHLQHTPVAATAAWMPFAWWGAERIARSRRGGVALVATATGMALLAGFTQLAVLGSLATGCWVLVRGGGPRPVGRATLAIAMGVLLAAPQCVPTWASMAAAARGPRTVADLQTESYHPAALVGAVLPRALGDPRDPGDWRRRRPARDWLAGDSGALPHQSANWSERTVFVGGVVFVFALIGVVAGGRRARAPAAIAALGLVMAMSDSAIALYGRLPVFAFGAPCRALVLTAFAVPLLGALGLQRLLDRESAAEPARRSPGRAPIVACAVAGIATGGAAARLATTTGLRTDLAILATLLLSFALLSELRRRRWSGRRTWVGAVLVLAWLELAAYFVPLNLPVPAAGQYRATPGIRFLQQHLGHDRFLRVSGDRAAAVADRVRLLHPNQGVHHQLRDAQGYRELIPRAVLDYWQGLPGLLAPVGFTGIPAARAADPRLDLAAVRYLVAAGPLPELASTQVYPDPDAHDADLWIYRNPGALPRARVVPRQPSAAPPGDRPDVAPGASIRGVRWHTDSAQRLILTLAPGPAGWLMVADTWSPDWRAVRSTADGRREAVPLATAHGCFRAVPVTASTRRVELHHRPRPVALGRWLGALGLLLGLASLRRRRPSP